MKTFKKKLALLVAIAICISAFAGCDIGKDKNDEKEGSAARAVVLSFGDVEVTSEMMSFFLSDTIMNWHSNYGGYSSLFSVDLSRDLRSQQYGAGYEAMLLGEFQGTWYDYFLNRTLENVKMYAIYANEAKAAGLSLTDNDKADIEDTIASIKESLEANNSDFADQYGKGVKESDVRACYELISLAGAFADYKQEQLEIALDEDDTALREYVENNKEEFYNAKCLKYSATIKEYNLTAEDYQKLVDKKKELAEKMISAKTPEEFIDLMEGKSAIISSDPYETDVETVSPEVYESKKDKYSVMIEYSTEDGGVGEWLFGNGGADVGDAKYFEETGTEIVTIKPTDSNAQEETNTEAYSCEAGESDVSEDKLQLDSNTVIFAPNLELSTNVIQISPGYMTGVISIETVGEGFIIGSGISTEPSDTDIKTEAVTESYETVRYDTYRIEVYYVLDGMALDTEFVHNFAYLMVDDEEIAKAFKEEFEALDVKTLDSFYSLAEKKHDSSHGTDEHDHSEKLFEFNKLEKQPAGLFNDTYAALNAWVEDDGRRAGDLSDIIKVDVTGSYSKVTYTVVFFGKDGSAEGEKGQTWYVNAYAQTVSYQLESWYSDQLASGKLKIDNQAMKKIKYATINVYDYYE